MLSDESYIKLTLEIAKRGGGYVSPNPLVGCIIIKNEKIIGAGYHECFGQNHAEVNAINSSKEDVAGSTLYINLEPCSHYGKTPPCVDKIIQSKIKKVVIGTLDMNPIVSGKGVKKLKEAGIEVKVGVLEDECIRLNKFFFKHIVKKVPYVTLKAAQTLDGKIADSTGYSKWISSMQSRKYVHSLRSVYDAVLIGKGTALKDNPRLTVRLSEGRNPKRILIDANLEVPLDHHLYTNNSDKRFYLVTSEKSKLKKKKTLLEIEKKGVNVIFVKEEKNCPGHLKLQNILKQLGNMDIASVLVEGGSNVFTSFVKENLFDDILLFISPKLIGNGVPIINDFGLKSIKNSRKLKVINFEKIGDDILMELGKN